MKFLKTEYRITTNGVTYRLEKRQERAGWRRALGPWGDWKETGTWLPEAQRHDPAVMKEQLRRLHEIEESERAKAKVAELPWTPTSLDPLVDELEKTFGNNG